MIDWLFFMWMVMIIFDIIQTRCNKIFWLCTVFWSATGINYCGNGGGNDCHADATCILLAEGSYKCICKPGYKGNGQLCEGKISDSYYAVWSTSYSYT